MAGGRISQRKQLGDYLPRTGWSTIGEGEFRQLLAHLAPITEQNLRRLLRDCGLPLAPLVEGVRQNSFDDLERTLLALTDVYVESAAERRQAIRSLVITARDHARFAVRRTANAEVSTEMALWMDTWLGYPEAFPLWLRLRKQYLR